MGYDIFMKIILTKSQAVATLHCIEKKIDIDRFYRVQEKDKKFKLSCQELEKEIFKYIDADSVAAVVDDPVFLDNKKDK